MRDVNPKGHNLDKGKTSMRSCARMHEVGAGINSLPAMDAHERPLFNELLRGLVTLLIFVHC